MNSRERFLAVSRFEKPDYVPLLSCDAIDGPMPDTVWAWQAGQGLPAWVGRPDDKAEEEFGPEWQGYERFKHYYRDWDRFWGMTRAHVWTPRSAVTMPPAQVLADDGEFLTLEFADGRVERQMYDNDDRYGMPEFIRYPLADPGEWPAYQERWLPLEDGVYPAGWEAVAARWRERDYPLGTSLPGTFGVLRSLFGTARAAMLFHDEPALVRAILAHYRRRAMRMLEPFMAAVRPDFVYIGEDYCYRSGCFVSPAMFREFFFPHYREELAYARSFGCEFVVVDSDGFVERILPLLEEVGIRSLQAFEPRAGNDVVRIREHHPSFVVWGGLDKYVMDQERPEVIDAEIDRKAPPLLAQGGFFPGVDHGLPYTARYRSYYHFMCRLHELTGNPEGDFWGCRPPEV
jgi:hypothetical protein